MDEEQKLLPCESSTLPNDFVHAQQHRLGNRDAKSVRGLEVDDQLELGGLFHREIRRNQRPPSEAFQVLG
jgi:hypothetical protein